jgi:transposase
MDATMLRLFPPLRAAWGFPGEQIEVAITGRNAKRVLLGAINPVTGHRVVVRCRRLWQQDFQAFLLELRRRYRSRPICLLLDRAPAHTAVRSLALAPRLGIGLYWLPKQCSELNAMDQLWKDLKRQVSANRQYATVEEHAAAAEAWVLGLTPRQALRKAGILAPKFWLRDLLQNFWPPT